MPSDTPAFLDSARPHVPDLVISRGVVPFHLPERPVRGRLVRLGALADALLTRHDNPDAVTALAGEALALVAGLASALKYQGSFSLQARGDGAVPMLLADCTDDGALRGYARVDAEKYAALRAAHPHPDAAALLGTGYLAFTVDQGPDTDRYQGIVAIEGATLAEMALAYFSNSEQLRCSVRLAAARAPGGGAWRAAALVLERVAEGGGIDLPVPGGLEAGAADDAWHTATTLAATVTDAELLDDDLPPSRLIHRVFGTEGVVLGQPRALAFGCRCSRAKLSGILEGFSADDLDHMTVDGAITMTCEFCNCHFAFERSAVTSRTIPATGR